MNKQNAEEENRVRGKGGGEGKSEAMELTGKKENIF